MAASRVVCSLREIVDELLSRCSRGEFGMVVIDPAYMVQDDDENNAKDIREFFARIDRLCVGLGCTVMIPHHHSKGDQGLKSSTDRSSGSGLVGRAPDAVFGMTDLVLEPDTPQIAREVKSLAATKRLTGWRVSFTLCESAPVDSLDVWRVFPLRMPDMTGLLADCKLDFGGQSEQRKMRQEAEANAKVAEFDATCMRLMDDADSIARDKLEEALGCTRPTVNRWLDKSRYFMRCQADNADNAPVQLVLDLKVEPVASDDEGDGDGER